MWVQENIVIEVWNKKKRNLANKCIRHVSYQSVCLLFWSAAINPKNSIIPFTKKLLLLYILKYARWNLVTNTDLHDQ